MKDIAAANCCCSAACLRAAGAAKAGGSQGLPLATAPTHAEQRLAEDPDAKEQHRNVLARVGCHVIGEISDDEKFL